MQSTFYNDETPKLHLAIIMDGNGRWATSRGLPRVEGHRKGMETVRRIVEAAPSLDISTLTLYAFSSDNWKRPQGEVSALMKLFQFYLKSEVSECIQNDVRLSIIGRRDRFSGKLQKMIAQAEEKSKDCKRLHLRIAADYSARDQLLTAAQRCEPNGRLSRDDFAKFLAGENHTGEHNPDVDILIRTGGEQRLSDFLLWECAYAELFFLKKMWPAFDVHDLESVVYDFKQRDRRFGMLNEQRMSG